MKGKSPGKAGPELGGRAESRVAAPSLEPQLLCADPFTPFSSETQPRSKALNSRDPEAWTRMFLKSGPLPTAPHSTAVVGQGSADVHLSLQNLTREQADYCVSHMKPYVDRKGRELPTAFDYVEFTRSLFVN